jgi:hypothetical protein
LIGGNKRGADFSEILVESLESITTAGLDPQIASFHARKRLLSHELESWNADIYCFQEVDQTF